MEKDEKKTDHSLNRLNNILKKLNKTSLIGIVVIYILLLAFLLYVIKPRDNYVTFPENYMHEFWNEELSPQITIVANRTVNDNKVSLRYSITSNTIGRGESADPHYKLLSDDKPDAMYYFTELTSYTTPITNSFTLDNSSKNQHPLTMYARLEYTVDKVKHIASFEEPIMLQPTDSEKTEMQKVYDDKYSKYPELAAAISKSGPREGTIQFSLSEKESDKHIYYSGVSIKINDKKTNNYHIDMQSWIITKSGEYLPFIGVYNFSSQRDDYRQSNREIDKRLEPEYICCVLKYTTAAKDDSPKELDKQDVKIYYQQKIENLHEYFDASPKTEPEELDDNPSEKDPNEGNTEYLAMTDKMKTIIGISAGVGVAIIVVLASVVFVKVYNKKEEKKYY